MATKKKAAESTDEAKVKRAEKLAKAKEKVANRPEGQRPNSKSFDVIELSNGGKVTNYAQNVRKFGVVVTSVATDKDGNVVSTSISTVPGFSVKSKKGHGNLIPKMPGVKRGQVDDVEGEDDGE